MGNDARRTRRHSSPTAVLITALGFIAVAAASAFITASLIAPPPPRVAVPGQETFEALRISDTDVASLGLSASESGHRPSTLATAAGRVITDWEAARGMPDSCMFAGTYRGISKVPVWGTETDADATWDQDAVSATQTLAFEGVPLSFITVSTRTFASAESAATFMSEHAEKVAGCPQFSTTNLGRTSATRLSPLLIEVPRVESAGWLASTDDWVAPGQPVETADDMLCWVVDLRFGNIVQRVTVVAPARTEARIGTLVDDLADVIAREMTNAVTTSE